MEAPRNSENRGTIAARVVKVGGSLLSTPRLDLRVASWLRQSCHPTVVITGGGVWADQVRELDRRARIGDRRAHELAIRAMSLTGWLVASCCPTAVYVDRWEHLTACLDKSLGGRSSERLWVFDAAQMLSTEESVRAEGRLPIGWHVTSDSIAAHVAKRLGARQLVLLKSCLPLGRTVTELASEGYVDQYFAQSAGAIDELTLVRLPDGMSRAIVRA
jgi:aspartokinase-like uncharacterized kinase